MTWPYEQEWLDYKAAAANVVVSETAFTSGTTKTTDAGFEDCKVGTLLITNVTASGGAATTTVYVVTAVADDKIITGKQISNAS